MRFSAASVSGSTKAVSARLRKPAAASPAKISRQLPTAISPLPASGASIGATEITSITFAISRVAAGPECRSRMIARGTTITVAAPIPCTSRAATRASIDGASAHAERPDEKDRQPHVERRLAPELVRRRPVGELRHPERQEEGRQRELRRKGSRPGR